MKDNFMRKEFNIIAHRGFSELSPENTFPAFDLALKSGFPNFEFDVQLTKDQIPVVIHDYDLYRTTGVNGLISEKSFKEIKNLQAKNNFKLDDEKYSIPKLDDLLKKYKDKSNLHLELKSRDQELPEIVLESLKNNGWLNSNKGLYEVGGISISSFFVEQIIRFRKLNQNERTAWLLEKITKYDLEICKDQKIDLICPRAKFSNINSVNNAKEKNILVRNWGVSNKQDLITAFNSESTGTTLDWPLKGKEILQNYENNKS
ncbi:MAG: glycerophosphodiester phosphodiesterase family protein [Chloroflexota bacterium]|nr:glycerophosphodiester phosphodiesterase family protein [Chloroflexota bacterium]